ncbi:MAG: MarR family winged helix-turn-helix transcriptional regulator [Phycisphaerae bacterium]
MSKTQSKTPKVAVEDAVDRIAGECLAVRIRLLNRTITSIFDDALRPLGIKVSQLNVLMVVAKKGTATPSEICGTLNMEKSTLSRNLDRMKDRGWLLGVGAVSGRRQQLEISAAGRRLIEKALPLWEQAQNEAEALLGSRGSQSIHRAADTVWKQLNTT